MASEPKKKVVKSGFQLLDDLTDIRFGRPKRKGELEHMRELAILKEYADNPQPNVMSIKDLEGKPFVTSMSDRTDAGGLLTQVKGVDLKDPVQLRGGQGYMFDQADPEYVWASAPGAVSGIQNMADYLYRQTGEVPFYLPWRMAPSGGDFAQMTGETMIQYARANMSRAQKKALNAELKELIPGWKSIDSKGAIELYRSQPDKIRKASKNMMDTKFRNEGGLSIGEARLSVTAPEQVNAPDGYLQNVGIINMDAPKGASTHPAYPAGLPGEGVGVLAEDVPVYGLQPQSLREIKEDVLRQSATPLDPTATDLRSMQMAAKGGIITEGILRHLEDLGVLKSGVAPTAATFAAAAAMLPTEDAEAGMGLKQLIKAGYPESTAKKIASGELPMDFVSRMKRAAEQGFDTKGYHTGTSGLLDVDPDQARSFENIDTGTWFSTSPEVSSSYARDADATMYPALIRTEGMDKVDAGGAYWSMMDDATMRGPDGKVVDVEWGVNPTTDNFAQFSKRRGAPGTVFDAVVDTGPAYKEMRAAVEGQGQNYMDFLADYQKRGTTNIAVQDPTAVRSLLGAAFDPDQRESANILAANPMASTVAAALGGASLLGPDEAEAARIPKNTVEAYKLFRTKAGDEGLYPLFVDSNTPVNVGEWTDAIAGEMAKDGKKVKSKIGPLAYRPGWHAGDMPMATHIGGKSTPDLTAPDYRPADQQWAKVEMGDDYDWQTEALSRAGRTKDGRIKAVEAQIADQIPEMGHYRYKTNPNMTGEWLIGGEMKPTGLLSPDEVAAIGKETGHPDLPILPRVIEQQGLKWDDLTAEAKKELKKHYPDLYKRLQTGKTLSAGGTTASGVGLIGALAAMPDEARAEAMARIGDNSEVGSIQAAGNPKLQKIAGILGDIDTPIGKPFESTSDTLLRWAYGDEADTIDKIFMGLELADMGLLGAPAKKAAKKAAKGIMGK